MSQNEALKKFVNEHISSKSGKIMFKNRRFNSPKILHKTMKSHVFKNANSMEKDVLVLFSDDTKSIKFIYNIFKFFRRKNNKLISGGDSNLKSKFQAKTISLRPMMDVRTKDHIRMFDISKMEPSPISFEYWERVTDVETAKQLKANMIPCIFSYDPKNKDTIAHIEFGSGEVNRINLYLAPAWMSLKGSGKLPDLAKRFFSHLFPDNRVRMYIYNWMYHCMNDRAKTFLYMPGRQGIGKTIFSDICAALVGHNNYEVAKSDFAENTFNGYIENKRLIVLEEFQCWHPKQKDTLKRVINDRVQIESKGKDQRTVDNFCSFIMNNNNIDAVNLDPVDRRFSVPEMTDKKLEASLTPKEISRIKKECENPKSQFIADIGHWILDTFSDPKNLKYDADTAWQDVAFHSAVYASARDGYRFIINQVLSKKAKSYTYAKLRTEYRVIASKNATFPTYAHVRDYMLNFKYNGEIICTTANDGITLEIIPIKKYQPGGEK